MTFSETLAFQYEDLEFSLKGVSLATSQISMSRQGKEVVVTHPYNVRSAPDFTCSVKYTDHGDPDHTLLKQFLQKIIMSKSYSIHKYNLFTNVQNILSQTIE